MCHLLDSVLIREAQTLTTGAEIHRTSEAILVYSGAVIDANENEDPHRQADLDKAVDLFRQNLSLHVGKLKEKRFRW
jgi:hypothetical protein